MKKKLVALLICIFTTLATIAFSGCDLSATPTKSKVCDIVSDQYNVTLPDTIDLVNYSTNVGFDGGVWYCVFDYDGSDKEFNAILADEKDEDFEKRFKEKYTRAENYFNKAYEFPNLTNDYLWLFDTELSENNQRIYELLILYFPENRELIVIDDTLQNYG